MRRYRHIWRTIGILLCIAFNITAVAQENLITTYQDRDPSYTITYPATWRLDLSNDPLVMLHGTTPDGTLLSMTIIPPLFFKSVAPGVSDATVALNVLSQRLTSDSFRVTDETRLVSINGRDAAITTGTPGPNLENYIVVVRFANGDYGGLLVATEAGQLPAIADITAAVIGTYNNPGATSIITTAQTPDTVQTPETPVTASVTPTPAELPAQLSDYAADWQTTIAELQQTGYLNAGGALIFQEDEITLQQRGAQFFGLGTNTPYRQVIMAAEVHLISDITPDVAYEECSLVSRAMLTPQGDINRALRAGLDNTPNAFYVDIYGSGDADIHAGAVAVDVDMTQPQHILIIADGDSLTYFLNGQRIFPDALINDRNGVYGLLLTSADINTRCVVRNVWAYTLQDS